MPSTVVISAGINVIVTREEIDYVVDAIDNVAAKLHLIATCMQNGIPVVSVTGAGARLDPTSVQVAPLAETHGDPLARVLRKELPHHVRDAQAVARLPVVFSTEEVRAPIDPSWDDEVGFRCICPHREDSPHACEKRRLGFKATAGLHHPVRAEHALTGAQAAVKFTISE